jgi:CelD/BcsL family acetyltransferase involved in cellulose biosynthesis
MSAALELEPIRDVQALERLTAEWWRLWQRVPGASPFQSPAWLIPWWHCFSPGELRSVAVRREGRLIALAPFYLEDGALGRRLLPLGISVSDYFDVLIDPDDESTAGRLLLAHLTETEAAQALCCEELAPDAAALRLWGRSEWKTELQSQSACPVMNIGAAADDPLKANVPAGKLRKLRMARHRMERHDGVVRAPPPSAVKHFLHELFRLHEARWESRGERGVLADAAVRRFHETALPGLSSAGLLSLYGLWVGDRMIAGYYGFVRGERAYAYIGGFDPEFAFESPGTILIGHAIEEAAHRGATEFHFLRGREPYKYEWGATDRWNSRLELRREA